VGIARAAFTGTLGRNQASADVGQSAKSKCRPLCPRLCCKTILGAKRAILIQEQTPTRNVDSKTFAPRFDYCEPKARRRVLQHNPPETGLYLIPS
jgi:hypothetical protein